ncbi:MAG: ABC transporter ATP-binding protein [Paracoccaceae bacterium]|nr:ABC transporter ATP-binding protein [Paracoccaceae bacterium]
MIVLKSLTKRFGEVTAVRDVTLTVTPGEFVTLLGPSGCGKTTTLRMIAGFTAPTGGRVEMAGTDVTGRPPHRREVGLVFQSYALFPHMSVQDNVGFGLKMRKRPAEEVARRVDEALGLVKLADFADRYPSALSGGQQQRVALARALVIRPQLLLLDEPFGALDKQLRDHMQIELRTLQRQLALPTIFVTHDQGEALSMSDRVAIMNAGEVVQIGTPTELYERPRTAFVATFLGRSNVLELDVIGREGPLTVLGRAGLRLHATLPQSTASTRRVMVRPERVAMRPPDAGAPGAMTGTVRAANYFGQSIDYPIEVGAETVEAMSVNPGAGGFLPEIGAEVDLEIASDAVWPLDD